ncbi:MAG: ABC transporter ATP-binding protein [Saprospiraceae bacterium]
MYAIQCENINKSYKFKKQVTNALKDINLEVKNSELFGLIGPDGAGKTSLIRILTSLILPDSGTGKVDGLDIISDFEKVRTRIGYMPGRFSLYQDLSVEENLEFFASIFNTSVRENYYLIKDIYQQIEPFKKRRAGALSGGMKQKLALSCALIHKPSVLFLDEPTTGVDALSRIEFWDMLKSLQKQEITIFVSTPYMDEASLCDRIALIQHGEVLAISTPEEVRNNYQGLLWSLKSDNMFLLMQDLKSWEKTITCFSFGDSIHLSLKADVNDSLIIQKFLKDKNHLNINIEKIKPSVEDCFMQLMRST